LIGWHNRELEPYPAAGLNLHIYTLVLTGCSLVARRSVKIRVSLFVVRALALATSRWFPISAT
jgi:hypothetical protein